MQRWRVPEIILGALLAVAVFALGFSLSSPMPRQEQRPAGLSETNHQAPGENIFVAFWHWTSEDPVAFYTAILTLFTGVLGASTILLWIETRRSVNAIIAADQPRLKLSRLQLSRAGGAEPRDNSKLAMVTIGFTNYGSKSALVTEVCFEQLFAEDVPDAPNYQRIVRHPSYQVTIAPDQEHVFPDQVVWDDGNKKLAAVLNMPSALRFWVYGYVAYEDHLGRVHRVGFIGDWNHLGHGTWQIPDHAMQRGETFNVFNVKSFSFSTWKAMAPGLVALANARSCNLLTARQL